MIRERHLLGLLVSLSHSSMSTFLCCSSRVFKRLSNVDLDDRRYVFQLQIHCIAEPFGCTRHSSSDITKAAKPVLLMVVYIMVRPVCLAISSMIMFCCHLILRIRRRYRWWKVLIFFCIVDRVNVSLSYHKK